MPLIPCATIPATPPEAGLPTVEAVRSFLFQLVKNPPQHARFLNMLSMLEHMGSRKIMLSQMNRPMDEGVLKHLAEEARHAFFFKRQAEKVLGATIKDYTDANTFARAAASMYFGRLAAFISQHTDDMANSKNDQINELAITAATAAAPAHAGGAQRRLSDAKITGGNFGNNLAYPWTTRLVEIRACWFYEIYETVLREANSAVSLKSILAEEAGHLNEMNRMCGADAALLADLTAHESALFATFWQALAAR